MHIQRGSLSRSPYFGIVLFLHVIALTCCANTTASDHGVDGNRILGHVETMTSWGPHPAGSTAQRRVGSYLIEQLRSLGLEVKTNAFTSLTPLGPREMVNIWGILPGKKASTILLCSHYDSKYFPDFKFVGANDGGASSAMILELARILSTDNPLDYTVWFVLFDGEEAFGEWTDADSLYGSRQFVRMLRQKDQLKNVSAMILLDLIGGQDLRLRKDIFSTDWLNSLIWKQAERMGHQSIFLESGTTAAQDDHIPFREAGIPVVDLIDLRYAYWHTPEDTIDKLSGTNMEQVGNVILASLPKIQTRLEKNQ